MTKPQEWKLLVLAGAANYLNRLCLCMVGVTSSVFFAQPAFINSFKFTGDMHMAVDI